MSMVLRLHQGCSTGAGPAGGAGDSGGGAEEKSEFDIILKAAGDKKINGSRKLNYNRPGFKRRKDLTAGGKAVKKVFLRMKQKKLKLN